MTTRFSKRLELDYSIVLVAIFDLMLTGGIQPTDLLAVCARALKQAEAGVRWDGGGVRRSPNCRSRLRRLAPGPPLFKCQSCTKGGPSSWAYTERGGIDPGSNGGEGMLQTLRDVCGPFDSSGLADGVCTNRRATLP